MSSRSLSSLEKYYYFRNGKHFYANVAVSADYTGTRSLTPSTVFHALKLLIEKYHVLSLNVFEEGSEVSLGLVDSFAFGDVVEFMQDESSDLPRLGEIFKEIHHFEFDFSDRHSVLWKIKVVNQKTLIFYADHLLLDGMSMVNFHREFLECLNAAETVEEQTFDSLKDSSFCGTASGLNSPAQAIIKQYTPSWLQIGRFILGEVKNAVSSKLFGGIFVDPGNPPIPGNYEGDYELVRIDKAVFSECLEKLRLEGVKLTSFLVYSGLKAMAERVGKNKTKTSVPMNTRHLVPETIQQDCTFGLFVAGINLCLSESIEDSETLDWDAVRRINGMIKQQSSSNDCVAEAGMLDYVNIEQILDGKTSSGGRDTLQVSNLGKVIEESGLFRVSNVWFSQCRGVMGAYMDINSVSCSEGLDLVISGRDVAVLAGSVAKSFETCLD